MPDKNIVIVDDEFDMAQLLKMDLEMEHYQVAFALNGRKALELINKVHPDLVLLDIAMPEMDGYQVLEKLKANESTKTIPVIMLTARGLEPDIQKGLKLGADDYIVKPFFSELLFKRIKLILKE